MTEKIMSQDKLEDIMIRLRCCAALFSVLHANIAGGDICADAIAGACDLLEAITHDFQTEIETAVDYNGKAVQG